MRNIFSSSKADGPSKQQTAAWAADDFIATTELQIQAIGYDFNQALSCSTLENVPVFRVGTDQPEYISRRIKRSSNSCALVRANDPSENTLISTIYRIGPGRRPRMRIIPEGATVSVEEAIRDEDVAGERIEVKSHSMFSREQMFDTSLGKFTWRYGNRHERAEDEADSLLVMERTDRVPLSDGSKSESGARIAQFVRNQEFRTPGTKRNAGGNGGRLMLDLSMWDGEEKETIRGVEAFMVASCLLMLKREADRFRDNSIAAVV